MIYGYRCPECGEAYEFRYKMGEQPGEVPCIECGGVAVRLYWPLVFCMN